MFQDKKTGLSKRIPGYYSYFIPLKKPIITFVIFDLIFYFIVYYISILRRISNWDINNFFSIWTLDNFFIGTVIISVFFVLIPEIIYIILYFHYYKIYMSIVDAPSKETAYKIFQGGFTDFNEYQGASDKGATSKAELDLVIKYKLPDFKEYSKVRDGNFPDFETYEKALQLGTYSYNLYEEILKNKATNLETLLKFQDSNFPNFQSFEEATKNNIKSYSDFLLFKNFNTDDKTIAEEKFLSEMSNILSSLSEQDYQLHLDRLDIDENILKLFFNNRNELVTKLINKSLINANFDLENRIIEFVNPTTNEKLIVVEFLNSIQENVPVFIDRISEKTEIKKHRVERIIELLLKEGTLSGRYLDIEGIYIRRPVRDTGREIQEINYTCNICKSEDLVSDDEIVWCPICINSFHLNHILEWIKVQGKCPICQNKIDHESLIKQK